MIIVSLLLIVLAAILLGVGLSGSDNDSLVASIAVSLLASISLVVRGRMIRSDRETPDDNEACEP
jgi:hypothetical protein